MATADEPTKPPSKAAALKAAQQYLEAADELDALNKRADVFKRSQKLALATCAAYLGDKDRVSLGGGIVVREVLKRASVFWKDEVVRLKGPEYVAQLQEAAPEKRSAEVVRKEA